MALMAIFVSPQHVFACRPPLFFSLDFLQLDCADRDEHSWAVGMTIFPILNDEHSWGPKVGVVRTKQLKVVLCEYEMTY